MSFVMFVNLFVNTVLVCVFACIVSLITLILFSFLQLFGLSFLLVYQTVVSSSASDGCLETLISEMIYNVSSRTKNFTYSLTQLLLHCTPAFWCKLKTVLLLLSDGVRVQGLTVMHHWPFFQAVKYAPQCEHVHFFLIVVSLSAQLNTLISSFFNV